MPRILVIEDDDSMRMMFHEMLEMAGHEVVEARDGDEAFIRCRHGIVDLIITDLIMPQRSGFEIIQGLKREFPELKVIAVTGWGRHLLPLARDFGADRMFEKPIGQDDLIGAIGELLGESPYRAARNAV